MQPSKREKVRIFALARELGMESKDLLTICQQHGLDIRNQLSTIEPEVRDQILHILKQVAPSSSPPAPAAAAPQAVVPPTTRRLVDLDARSRGGAPRAEPSRAAPTEGAPAAPVLPVAEAPVEPAPAPLPIPVVPPAPVLPAATAPVTPATHKPRVSPTPPAAPRPTTPPSVAPVQEKQVIPSDMPLAPVAPAPTPESVPAPRVPEQPAAARPKEPAAPARPAETPVRPVEATPARPETTRPAAAAPPVRPPAPQTPPAVAPRPPMPTVLPSAGRPPMRNLGSGGQRPPAPGQGGQRPAAPGQQTPAQGGPRPVAPGQGTPAQGGPGQSGPGGTGERRPPPRPGGDRARFPGTIRTSTPPPSPQRPLKPPEDKKPAQPTGLRKIAEIPPELMASLQGRGTNISVKDIEEGIRQQQQGARPGGPAPVVPGAPVTPPVEEDEDEAAKRRRAGGEPGSVPGRADRHKERSERQAQRKARVEPDTRKLTTMGLLDDDGPRYRSKGRKPPKQPPTAARKGKIPVSMPITVRSLSEALGRKVGDVLFKLLGHGLAPTTNINSGIDPDVAELVAIDFGVELEIKREANVEQDMLDTFEKPDSPEDLQSRAPVVAVMGHVDHGKTSLLDRIREMYGIKSDIVSTEAGGITQVLRAWRVEKDGKPITFLDTPGHEAFTKMRARGANVTDIAVIVVAANDGVMPQTEEAISHAKAAEVSIVVAINKVDLPDANLRKVEQQLMTLGLLPDTMGGDVPFVYTSAKSGKGIDELLEQLSVVAELNELIANPNKPASGTCLEAYLSEKEGVQATLLVQNGTLRPGDVVLCGASYGTVRKLFDDMGRVIDQAGPSLPVRIMGLDVVPNADDTFHVVEDLSTAREIAEERRERILERALKGRPPVTLESLKDAHIAELKIILKAEARGSIEAIRNELEKLRHEEVRVRLLHSAIGGINASDVQLAMTSPEDTLILGFNVVPDNEAKAIAEERGIQIREYDIIYKLADDIRSALEGKLKPREDVVHLGRAVIRETFKISRVGTIAGCFVTQGVIERNAKVRVIRSGVVVYPPADRSAGLESLKRFKDDVREVREGFECGIKIAGYDDIKVDDIIECYRIEQVQRSLS